MEVLLNMPSARVALDMKEAEALELIALLSKAVRRSNETGGAWLTLPVIVVDDNPAPASSSVIAHAGAPGRLTLRVAP